MVEVEVVVAYGVECMELMSMLSKQGCMPEAENPPRN